MARAKKVEPAVFENQGGEITTSKEKSRPRGLKQIKKVIGYETTDGNYHETFQEANRHQARLDAADRINAFIKKTFPNASREDVSTIYLALVQWDEAHRPPLKKEVSK